jgi:adenylylsulfate kinase-like enzyme
MGGFAIPVLWVSGPPGVGKTAVAWRIYERLAGADAAPAYVDVDQLGMCYPPTSIDPDRHVLKARSVASLGANFSVAGARCLIVSGVVDPGRGPEIDELGASDVVVCRLRVDPVDLRTRLERRAGSSAQPDAAVAEADAFDHSAFADWCVDTTGLSIEDAVRRVMAEIGDWPPTGADRRDSPPAASRARRRAGGELLWVSGTTGVGKSTVAFRVYLRVLRTGATAAFVDVDQIGFCSTAPRDHVLRARNLAALWDNFHEAGARLAVVVGPVSTAADARQYEQALRAVSLTWCRLHVGDEELTRRILSRQDGGSWSQPGDPLRDRPLEELVRRADAAVADARSLDRHDVGRRVDVDGLSVDDAADRLLEVARWPAGGPLTTPSS